MMRLSERARAGLALATALAGAAFGWAALVLPWRAGAPLGLWLWALAALHLCTALVAALWPARLAQALRLLAGASLASAPVFVLAILLTSLKMVEMYGPLGWGLTALLAVIGWLLLLCTLPVGLGLWVWLRRAGGSHAGG